MDFMAITLASKYSKEQTFLL